MVTLLDVILSNGGGGDGDGWESGLLPPSMSYVMMMIISGDRGDGWR